MEKFYSKHDPDFKKLKSLGTHLGEHTEIVAKEVEHQKWAKFEEAKHIEALERTILPDWLYDYLRFREKYVLHLKVMRVETRQLNIKDGLKLEFIKFKIENASNNLQKYIGFGFRFDLLDRVGDGIIDTEEYEYVLSEFHIKVELLGLFSHLVSLN